MKGDNLHDICPSASWGDRQTDMRDIVTMQLKSAGTNKNSQAEPASPPKLWGAPAGFYF